MDVTSEHANEAQTFLESDFALFALQVIRAELTNGECWGDISDYLGQFQRVAKQRMATSEKAHQVHELFEEFALDDNGSGI